MQLLRIKHSSLSSAAAPAPAASGLAASRAMAKRAGQPAGQQPVGAAGKASVAEGSSSSGGGGGGSSSSSSSGDDEGRGLISWFPVHCTSMNNTNPYVSGDNKGAAAQLLEKASRRQRAMAHNAVSSSGSEQASKHSRNDACRRSTKSSRSWLSWHWQLLRCLLLRRQPATSPTAAAPAAAVISAVQSVVGQARGFVAAFAQSSVADTSPNVQGAFCLDTGVV
jgi:hypothetical protein